MLVAEDQQTRAETGDTAEVSGQRGGVATQVPEYAGDQANHADGIRRHDAYRGADDHSSAVRGSGVSGDGRQAYAVSGSLESRPRDLGERDGARPAGTEVSVYAGDRANRADGISRDDAYNDVGRGDGDTFAADSDQRPGVPGYDSGPGDRSPAPGHLPGTASGSPAWSDAETTLVAQARDDASRDSPDAGQTVQSEARDGWPDDAGALVPAQASLDTVHPVQPGTDGHSTAPVMDAPGRDNPEPPGSEQDGDVVDLRTRPPRPEAPPDVPPGGQTGDAGAGQAAEQNENRARPDTSAETALQRRFADLQAQIEQKLQDTETRHQAALDSLKADYETDKARDRQQIDDLRAELQAFKENQSSPADAPGNTGTEAEQPRAGGLPEQEKDAGEARPEHDKPGWFSNAKSALYGAVGTTVTAAAVDQFAPGVAHPVVDIAAGGITAFAALVPVLREGWKRRHDD